MVSTRKGPLMKAKNKPWRSSASYAALWARLRSGPSPVMICRMLDFIRLVRPPVSSMTSSHSSVTRLKLRKIGHKVVNSSKRLMESMEFSKLGRSVSPYITTVIAKLPTNSFTSRRKAMKRVMQVSRETASSMSTSSLYSWPLRTESLWELALQYGSMPPRGVM